MLVAAPPGSGARLLRTFMSFHSDPLRCEALLAGIVGSSRRGVAVVDPQYRLIGFNEALRVGFERRFKRAPRLGASVFDFMHGRDRLLAAIGGALRGEAVTLHETLDAAARFEVSVYPLREGTAIAAAVLDVGVVDVAAHDSAEELAERTRTEQRLLEADRRKDEFIATLAHELRNPLAPILSSIQLLQLQGDADVARQRAKDIIERQVHQMARLVDDLLDISRITLGKLSLRREPVELHSVVEQALELARPHVVALEHRLSCALPEQPVHLVGDGTRLAQVLANLLINAAKYTPRRGDIALAAAREGDEAVLRVRDTGIGIAPEHLTALFDKFAQVRPAHERSGGLGIGLALAKGLVHLHGGTISATSAGLGAGAEFVIRLPLSRDAPPTRPATMPPVRALSGLRVLVADDNEDAVESAALVLALNGNEVKQAADGLEAVEAADRYRPDVVLLDIGMPKLNGFEACRRIRAAPWGKDMLVVAVTGWGQEEDRRRTAEAGFDAHFTKPVDFASVMALIGQRRALRTH
jgi:signal transduction histidine kinase/CheY-like chemotaxis protein